MKLNEAWSKETSADPKHWTPENPALGHCAVSSLIIQDLLGGELLRTKINGISHYCNRLPNGQRVDVTREQFPEITSEEEYVVRSRDYVLSFSDTVARYDLLKQRLG
jgi:hypothetical protein